MFPTVEKQSLVMGLADLARWADGFNVAKRAEGLSRRTQTIYRQNLAAFVAFALANGAEDVEHVDADLIRQWLLSLEEHGHNPAGVHQFYRTLKTFLNWYELEAAADGWRNPIKRVKSPKLPEKLLPPVEVADFQAIVDVCKGDREAERDRAILLTLFDSGVRAAELCALDVGDFDTVTGALTVKHGKGGKVRAVFAGQKTRRALRAYLKERGNVNDDAPLFATRSKTRLTYMGLRSMIKRRADAAGVHPPAVHAFRRGCALALLRNGADVVSVARVLGHRDLTVVQRYLKQTPEDLRQAHAAASPVDRAG